MPEEVFVCPEESNFYSHCLEMFFSNYCRNSEIIVEFGTGDGKPMIKALLHSPFQGIIHGFEINEIACRCTNYLVHQYHLEKRYVLHCKDFFYENNRPPAHCLVTNPPYLPAPDAEGLYLPGLYGGLDGNLVSKELISLSYESILLLMSSFSNPLDVLSHAATLAYAIAEFQITSLPFGRYSSQPKVKNRIAELRQEKKAFYSESIYLLAGVVFQQATRVKHDLSAEFACVIQAL